MVMCRPGLSVPTPNAWSITGAKSVRPLSRHGYSGAYLASSSSVGLLVEASWMRLFLFTDRKPVRSREVVVSVPYRASRLSRCSTMVLLVTVASVSACTRSGAASA